MTLTMKSLREGERIGFGHTGPQTRGIDVGLIAARTEYYLASLLIRVQADPMARPGTRAETVRLHGFLTAKRGARRVPAAGVLCMRFLFYMCEDAMPGCDHVQVGPLRVEVVEGKFNVVLGFDRGAPRGFIECEVDGYRARPRVRI